MSFKQRAAQLAASLSAYTTMGWVADTHAAATARDPSAFAAAICPKAPPGAVGPTNELTGYVLWGVGILFVIGLIVGLGAVVGGRVFAMPHASRAGVMGLVVVFVAAVAYLVLPSMLDGILGSGCI